MKNSVFTRLLTLAALLIGQTTICRIASACPDIDNIPDLNCDQQLQIVAFGDSITYGRGDTQGLGGWPGRLKIMFPHITIFNLGDPGERTSAGKPRAAKYLPAYPSADYVLILEGVNDYFASDHTAAATKSNLVSMMSSGSRYGAKVMLGSLTDVRRDYQRPWVLSVNSAIKSIRKIDYFSLGSSIVGSDGLHPVSSGYQLMANLAASVVQQIGNASRPADTDADGIYDFKEAQYGATVGVADTDGDGVKDGAEIFTYHSKPNSLNSDGDDFTDADEILTLHSNPADARPGAPTLTDLTILP